VPTTIVGDKCDPKDGSSDINPQDYQEKITVAFNEQMAEVTVHDTNPKFPFTTELDKDTLIIKFQDGYIMPKNTHFTIWLVGKDPAGNLLQKCSGCYIAEYSFTTIKN
jgi:hypothetical protein